MDAEIEAALRQRALPHVHLLPVTELIRRHPGLAAAGADRTEGEFQLTTVAWLFRHQLPLIPQGELLTFVASDLYCFSSPEPLFAEVGNASVVLSPHRYVPAFAALERFGKYNNGWVALRHDVTGLACAANWAEQCLAWCFTLLEPTRYGNQKYLDAWPAQFPGTIVLAHPGLNLAPWNVGGATLTASPAGPYVNGQPLIFYHFHFLRHLARQLYDPGLHRFGVTPPPELRELVYQPYLRELRPVGAATDDAPDIIPPARADDPRAGLALGSLTESLRVAREETASHQSALAKVQAADREQLLEGRATLASTLLHLQDVEADRAAQRLALLKVNQDLKQAAFDLERTENQIEAMRSEAAAQSAGKDAQIASLTEELAKRAVTAAQVEQEDVRAVMEPFSRTIRRLLVVKYHPRLLPEILWLALFGVNVEVLGCPAEFNRATAGLVNFHPETFLEWLGQIDSLFNERAYRQANPDVAAAIDQGSLLSGWDHYLRFGQRERRPTGTPTYCTGVAEFDAVAFDGSDAGGLVPFLAGRLQPYQQLFISGFTPPTDWMPAGDSRSYVLGHTLHCARPPQSWLGPRQPANGLSPHLPTVSPEEIYPEKPAQRAEWPRISVVTFCHNQADQLEETLRSVLDQNYPNLEYIVVDGGSTDGSVEIIKRYAHRLVWRVKETVAEPAQALNRGFSRANGRILTWLNAGDRLAPGSLFNVGQIFLLHAVDVVSGRCGRESYASTSSASIHRNHYPLDRIQPLAVEELLDLDRGWGHQPFFCQPEVFFTREIFERAGGKLREDLDMGLDYDLWVRLAKAGARLMAVPEILAISREPPATPAEPDSAAALRRLSASHRSA